MWDEGLRGSGPEASISLEPAEIEFIARDPEVFEDVGNYAARHFAGRPGKGDQAIGAEWIGIMPVAAGVAKMQASDLAEAAFQLAAVDCGIFAHGSRGEDELVAESGWDGASGFKEGFQMRFGGSLETKRGFAPIASVRVTTGQQRRFGNPNAVFILTNLHFRERHNHGGGKLTCPRLDVKARLCKKSEPPAADFIAPDGEVINGLPGDCLLEFLLVLVRVRRVN